MLLTAQQIIEEQLLLLEETKGKPAQVGYDLSIKGINSMTTLGKVLRDKTIVPTYEPVDLTEHEGHLGYLLMPGAYDIVFHEGCQIPNNRTGKIRQRSSLLRSGAVIASSIFDPGFSTKYMGTVLLVLSPIFIEQDARVAQIYFQENKPVSDDQLYSGQFQGDAQRSSTK